MRRRKETSAKTRALQLLVAASLLCSGVAAANNNNNDNNNISTLAEPAGIPTVELDYERLGDVLLAGDFSGLSPITYSGQPKLLDSPTTNADQIITQFGQSSVFLSNEFSNGRLKTSCLLSDNKTMVLAGNFTTLFNHSTPLGLAAVDFSTNVVTPLAETSSINGSTVNALWCNQSEVFVGGSFDYSGSGGVATWHKSNNTWSLPAFNGFVPGSSINTITDINGNLVFGGDFSGLAMSSATHNGSNNSVSALLLQPGMQPVSLNLANATGYDNSSTEAQGSNASSVLCPLGDDEQGWKAGLNDVTGYINVTLAYTSQPTRIRLFNLPDGSGTKTFRIISEPAGSFMNLTYTDKQDGGKRKSCAAYCPLPEYDSKVKYTDFEFVNVVPTSSLKIELLDFYGSQAGLRGIELFEAGQYAFAYNAFNKPRPCSANAEGSDSAPQSANTELKGDSNWTLVDDFMSTTITDRSKLRSTYAQMNPIFDSYTVDRGLYEVLLYTPGCKSYESCAQRGQVNVTVYPGFGEVQSNLLYQTNEELKYDLVYNGTLAKGAYIRITPSTQNQLPVNLVAYKARLNYLGSPEGTNASKIFEFSQSNFTTSNASPVGKTPINLLGAQLNKQASVNALQSNGSQLIVGGEHFGSNFSNLLILDAKNTSSIQIGDKDSVNEVAIINGSTFVLGDKDTYYLANSSASQPLHIGSSRSATPFAISNQNFVAFSTDTANQAGSKSLSLWDLEHKQIDNSISFLLNGYIDSSVTPVNNATLYIGSLQIADAEVPGAAVVSERSQVPQPASFKLEAPNTAPSKSKRASSGYTTQILGGTYLNSTHALLVGQFKATTSDNTSALNALVLNTSNLNVSSALFTGQSSISALDSGASFRTAVVFQNDTLIIGGKFTGKFQQKSVQSLLFFKLENGSTDQPPTLDSTGDVTINVVTPRPQASSLLVGGQFSSGNEVANATCHGLCIYNIDHHDWTSPANVALESGSVVNDLIFETANKVVVAGQLINGNDRHQVGVYDFTKNSLEYLPSLPEEAKSLVILSNTSTNEAPVYVAAGSHYVKYFDSQQSQWQDLPDAPWTSKSTIATLSSVILQSSNNTASGSPFSPEHALLVSGSLNINGGQVSSVVYDGAAWRSMYGATSSSSTEGGSISSVFSQYGGNLKGGIAYTQGTNHKHDRPRSQRDVMPVGHVVGIACGIGLCCVLVLMLLYIIVELIFNFMNRTPSYQNLAQSRPTTDGMSGTKTIK